MNVHFRSDSSEWETPQEFFDRLDEEFHFDLDPCATKENAKCRLYYTVDADGLSKHWYGRVYMNPPYGRKIKLWVRHAYLQSRQTHCEVVVGLIPARTDTSWWHEWVMKAYEIRLVRGRLKFSGHKNSAPFPSAVVIWKVREKDRWKTGPVLRTMEARDD